MSQQGRGGMGSHKHGISGKSQKSPRLRFLMKLEAEHSAQKRKKNTCVYSSLTELMQHRRDR